MLTASIRQSIDQLLAMGETKTGILNVLAAHAYGPSDHVYRAVRDYLESLPPAA